MVKLIVIILLGLIIKQLDNIWYEEHKIQKRERRQNSVEMEEEKW